MLGWSAAILTLTEFVPVIDVMVCDTGGAAGVDWSCLVAVFQVCAVLFRSGLALEPCRSGRNCKSLSCLCVLYLGGPFDDERLWSVVCKDDGITSMLLDAGK